jgi:hypothetical protein
VTIAPLPAKTRAIPRPIPRLEPVTKQTLPAKISLAIIQHLSFYPKLTGKWVKMIFPKFAWMISY